jgi:hypothetical protein
MGGGNAQKSAMARERNAAAAAAEGRGGGGQKGISERGGDTAAKIAAGQAEKAERERKKVELAEKKKAAEEKEGRGGPSSLHPRLTLAAFRARARRSRGLAYLLLITTRLDARSGAAGQEARQGGQGG